MTHTWKDITKQMSPESLAEADVKEIESKAAETGAKGTSDSTEDEEAGRKRRDDRGAGGATKLKCVPRGSTGLGGEH